MLIPKAVHDIIGVQLFCIQATITQQDISKKINSQQDNITQPVFKLIQ